MALALPNPFHPVRRRRPGVRIRPESQPHLVELVDSVARGLQKRPPDRVYLAGNLEVRGIVVGGRSELHIGAPLLACLGEPELRAVVAHELSPMELRLAWPVNRLLRAWEYALQAVEYEAPRAARHARTVARLSGLADRMHRLADLAGTVAGGRPDALVRAVATMSAAGAMHAMYVIDVLTGLRLHRLAVIDLDDGWRRLLARGIDIPLWDEEDADKFGRRHPGLDVSLGRLADAPTRLVPPDQPVPLTPLAPADEQRLVAQAWPVTTRNATWVRFADAPANCWTYRANVSTSLTRTDVEMVLGRPPADDLETAQVMFDRYREYMVANYPYGEPPEALLDTRRHPPKELASLVEHSLFARGWRLEHPAVRGVLVSPTGERLDTFASVTFAVDGRADLSALLPYLS
jgi:hypothetical protein